MGIKEKLAHAKKKQIGLGKVSQTKKCGKLWSLQKMRRKISEKN